MLTVDVGAAEGCDLLILLFKIKIKDRSLRQLLQEIVVSMGKCVGHKKAPIACKAMGALCGAYFSTNARSIR